MFDAIPPGGRDRRLVSAILMLATIVLFFVAVSLVATALGYFGDTLLAFFLAWLLAFIISPIVTRIVDLIPRLPRVLATVLVYSAIVIAARLPHPVRGAGACRTRSPSSSHRCRRSAPTSTRSWRRPQGWLDSIGLEPGRPGHAGPGDPRQPRRLRGPADRPAPVGRGRQRRRHRDDADRVHPVDLHGHRPRPDHGLPLPARPAVLRGGGAAAADVGGALVRRASCAARRSWASSISRSLC